MGSPNKVEGNLKPGWVPEGYSIVDAPVWVPEGFSAVADKEDEEDFWKRHGKPIVGDMLEGTKQIGKTALGVLNAPSSFAWGALKGGLEGPSPPRSERTVKDDIATVGKAFKGGWEAVKKAVVDMEFTGFSDFYEAKTGKTPRDDIKEWAEKKGVPDPDMLADQLGLVLEGLGDMATDPLVGVGAIAEATGKTSLSVSQAIKKIVKAPENFKGKIPDKIIDQIKQLEGQEALLDVLQKRANHIEEYTDWWKKHHYEASGSPLERDIDRPVISKAPGSQGVPVESRADELAHARNPFGLPPTRPHPDLPKDSGLRYQDTRQRGLERYAAPEPDIRQEPPGIFSGELEGQPGVQTYRAGKPILPKEVTPSGLKRDVPVIGEKASIPRVPKETAGVLFGVEVDDEGELQFNTEKGMYGLGAGIAAGKLFKGKAGTLKISKQETAFREAFKNSPETLKILDSYTKTNDPVSIVSLAQKAWPAISRTMTDRFAVLKKVSPKAYEAARKFNSHKDQAVILLDDLARRFGKLGVQDDDTIITTYIDAHRNMTRAKLGVENPGGITLEEAIKSIKDQEEVYRSIGKDPAKLKDALEAFQQWTEDNMLGRLYESGIISEETVNSTLKRNQWYATYNALDYMDEDAIKGLPSGFKTSQWFSIGQQKEFKGLKGFRPGMKKDDPIKATLEKFVSLQSVAAKNEVATALLSTPDILKVRLAKSPKEFAILQKQGVEVALEHGWKTKFPAKDWDVISHFNDGMVEKYLVPKEVAESMKQLSPYQAPRVVQAVNAAFRASATTLNPAFLISNASRDAIMAYTTSPVYRSRDIAGTFQRDWMKGAWEAIKHEVGKESLVDDYIKSGGSFGYVGAEVMEGTIGSKSKLKGRLFKKHGLEKGLEVIKTPITLMEKMNSVVELAPRLGVFNRAMKKGYSASDAAMLARSSTIDFNQGGTWIKAANQWIPFLNARVRGKMNMVDALKNDTKNTLSKMVISTVVPATTAYLWNRLYYSDLYDDIPQIVRENYFCMIYGSEKNEKGKEVPKYFVIAKGDIGQIATSPTEYALDKLYKRDPKSVKELAVDWLSDLSPVQFAREGKVSAGRVLGQVLPPLAKAPIEVLTNTDLYFGTEIIPHYMLKSTTLRPEYQYTGKTPVTYKKLGEWLGISPIKTQTLARNLFTMYGKTGFDPKEIGENIVGRVIKSDGGAIERRSADFIENLGYSYDAMRLDAIKAVENDRIDDARDIMTAWNKDFDVVLKNYNTKFKEYGLEDQGGLRKDYRLTPDKMRNILSKREKDERTWVEKQLQGATRSLRK